MFLSSLKIHILERFFWCFLFLRTVCDIEPRVKISNHWKVSIVLFAQFHHLFFDLRPEKLEDIFFFHQTGGKRYLNLLCNEICIILESHLNNGSLIQYLSLLMVSWTPGNIVNKSVGVFHPDSYLCVSPRSTQTSNWPPYHHKTVSSNWR